MNKIACPICGKNLKYQLEDAGKRAKCPSCGEALKLPMPVKEKDINTKFNSEHSLHASNLAKSKVEITEKRIHHFAFAHRTLPGFVFRDDIGWSQIVQALFTPLAQQTIDFLHGTMPRDF